MCSVAVTTLVRRDGTDLAVSETAAVLPSRATNAEYASLYRRALAQHMLERVLGLGDAAPAAEATARTHRRRQRSPAAERAARVCDAHPRRWFAATHLAVAAGSLARATSISRVGIGIADISEIV
jgi:hypothetical protein